jgi:serine/threonine-protein kinase
MWGLFHEALEKPPSERTGFLDAACSDAVLREKLDRLIAANDQASDFLEEPAIVSLPSLEEELDDDPGAGTDGAPDIGSYRLAEKIGAGGMGVVWKAEHRMLGRPAAIKLIRCDLSAPRSEGSGGDSELAADDWCLEQDTLQLRFEREARAIGALSSPHTVALYDFGVTEQGQFYYAMELLDGLSLGSLVREFGPLPPERVVCILREVCESLADAHHRGMIHRDIKPANIYVCRVGTRVDYVKVLDFGLVKTFTNLGEVSLTMKGATVGTPAFLAPETVKGDGAIDGRADIYSLGCVAYWMLTGTHVFTGTTIRELFRSHVGTAPTPPSSRHELPVPPSLDKIVLQCLEKDPARRPSSAEELSDLLRNTELAPAWTQQRARSWWDLHI